MTLEWMRSILNGSDHLYVGLLVESHEFEMTFT